MSKPSKVEREAVRWWRSKRPIAWSETRHLANPTVNTCTDSEKRLATHVAVMLTDRKVKR
jgi:hypothetical protein